MPVRTPDGRTYDESELDHGEECSRCGRFVPVRDEDDLPPTPDTPDWYHGTLKGYAGPKHIVDGKNGFTLCPDCRDHFDTFMEGLPPLPPREPLRKWVEQREQIFDVDAGVDEIVSAIEDAIREAGGS